MSVFRNALKLITNNTNSFRLPLWYLKYNNQLLTNIYDFKTIKHYTIWHDISKPFIKQIDESGKVHYPDHANKSAELFRNHIRNDNIIIDLIGLDMLCHTSSFEEICKLKLPTKIICTLLISALAELHSNAELFGGIESDSFKIKFKRLEKLGSKLCKFYFEKAYVYIITRTDLSIPQQMVQSAHAALECGREFVKLKDEHPSIIICSAKNENKLKDAIQYCYDNNIKLKVFREPDIGNQITSIATEPLIGDRRNLMKKYQLIK